MPVENIIILLAAWITSLGLLGVLVSARSSRGRSREAGERVRFKPTRAAAHRNGRMVRARGKSMERERYWVALLTRVASRPVCERESARCFQPEEAYQNTVNMPRLIRAVSSCSSIEPRSARSDRGRMRRVA